MNFFLSITMLIKEKHWPKTIFLAIMNLILWSSEIDQMPSDVRLSEDI